MGRAEKVLSKGACIGADIMIFVTVGTHEQPFDRLVKAVDDLKKEKIISQEIFIQSGFSTFKPQYCDYAAFIGFSEMLERMSSADIVISHGGTGSVMLALYHNKIPLVIPRQKQYNEHIDNHQVHFCQMMEGKRRISAVYEIENLGAAVNNYHLHLQEMNKQGSYDGAPMEMDINKRARVFAGKLNAIIMQMEEYKKRKR
ncbi:MAG: multidrug MFS transporter [Acidobacteria bacterium]|jgi:UDP-N-acetylglucosamine transferase subunit ALG13|nr:multidrug MFS transporter [Acidobacteriota bacterium]